LLLALLLSCIGMLTATALAAAATNADAVAKPEVVKAPDSVCRDLIGALKEHAATVGKDRYTAQERAEIASMPLTGCEWRGGKAAAQSNQMPIGVHVTSAYAGTSGCKGFWETYGVWSGPFPIIVSHTNVGMCRNGYSSAWGWWGPNCYLETTPAQGGGMSWCGIWQNGACYPQAGNNFYWFNWNSPWWYRYGYMRVEFSCLGGGRAVWGNLG
jgi:hypothetical protein